MRRMLCVAMAALVFSCLTAPALARTHVFARTKCIGLYCAIVTEPERRREPRPATWRRGFTTAVPPRERHHHSRALVPARKIVRPAPVTPTGSEVLAHP